MIVLKRDPILRREAAITMVESGISQRQAAKLLGVDEGTIRNDVRKDSAKNAEKVRTPPATGSAETKERRAHVPLCQPAACSAGSSRHRTSSEAVYVAQGLTLGASSSLARFSQFAASASQNARSLALAACLPV